MKKFSKYNLYIFLIMILNIIFIYKVNAATNPYPATFKGNMNCTHYAWKMAYERAGVALPAWGNANTWYDSAVKAGYSVGTIPRANSIAIWTNCSGDCADYGHVGYVESVSDDGTTLYIKDSSYRGMNGCIDYEDQTYKECILNGVSEETDRICAQNAPKVTCGFRLDPSGVDGEGITKYIYLSNAPKKPETIAPTTTTTTIKKSSNNNLNDLSINNINFQFNKEILEYSIEVENETEEIIINAVPEDEKAKFEIIGEKNIIVGQNIFKIKVTAEDGSIKEYTINIIRKEKKTEKVTNKNIIKKEQKNNNSIIIFIIVIGIVIAAALICIIVKKLKKKKN